MDRDLAIKKFAVCFDLAWKSIKAKAQTQKTKCDSPRTCLRAAFQLKIVDYDENWLKMMNDKLLAGHIYKRLDSREVYPKLNYIYKELYANEIYSRLPLYLSMLKKLLENLSG